MAKIQNVLFVTLGAFALSGCATVMNGPNQDLEVKSEPDGATAKLTNGYTCTTPCKVEVPRRNDMRVDIKKDGYKPTYVLVQSKLGGATFGNLIAGGIVGGLVDSSNGSSKKLSPNPVSVKLVAEGASGEEMLLDKKGKEMGTLAAHNDKVRVDVAKTIGNEAAGVPATGPAAAAAAEPAPSPPTPAPTGN